MSEENKNKDEIVVLENTGKIDLPKFDAKPFVGKEAVINLVDTKKGMHGYYVLIEAQLLEGEFNDEPIKATVLLGLQEDKEGKIGWGEDTKMCNFLKFHGVDHYDKLMGVKVTTSIKLAKDGKAYLTF